MSVETNIAFNVGVQAERERISKLLEEASTSFKHFDYDAEAITNFLIGLIKGQANE